MFSHSFSSKVIVKSDTSNTIGLILVRSMEIIIYIKQDQRFVIFSSSGHSVCGKGIQKKGGYVSYTKDD